MVLIMIIIMNINGNNINVNALSFSHSVMRNFRTFDDFLMQYHRKVNFVSCDPFFQITNESSIANSLYCLSVKQTVISNTI